MKPLTKILLAPAVMLFTSPAFSQSVNAGGSLNTAVNAAINARNVRQAVQNTVSETAQTTARTVRYAAQTARETSRHELSTQANGEVHTLANVKAANINAGASSDAKVNEHHSGTLHKNAKKVDKRAKKMEKKAAHHAKKKSHSLKVNSNTKAGKTNVSSSTSTAVSGQIETGEH